MKIDYSSQKVQMDAYIKNTDQSRNKETRDTAPKKGNTAVRNDRVELSSGSRLLQKVHSVMKAEEPGRAEKLNMLKEQVHGGTYKIKPEKIAESMLNDMIKNLG